MSRLIVSSGLVLSLCLLSGATSEILVPARLAAAPGGPTAEELAAMAPDWDKNWDRALKDSASDYVKLAKKYDEKLQSTAAWTRRYALRYLPDDEELRKYLGYAKARQTDGTEKWERVDTRRDEVAQFVDLDDPKQTKYGKERDDTHKKVANRFKGLAKKAVDNGTKDTANAAAWTDKAKRAWDRVVEVDPQNDEACKALAWQKYQGKYASPFKMQFIKTRDERKHSGEKTLASKVDAAACEIDGLMVKAGLTGGGAKSAHMTVNATQGKDVAIRLCQAAEKAMNDLCDIYAFDPNCKERLAVTKFSCVKDEGEFRTFLEKGAGRKKAEIQNLIDLHIGGTSAGPGERIQTTSGGTDGDDSVMNTTAYLMTIAEQGVARADLGSSVKEELEDWIWQSIGYDVTKRVLGTASTVWAQFGRYGQGIEDLPGQDKWIQLAQRQVESDDDIPLAKLPKLKQSNVDFKGPETVKGWAFLQFVFEKDPAKAKEFVKNALANGTAEAVKAIYPDNPDSPDADKSMEKLDAEYREWIMKAW